MPVSFEPLEEAPARRFDFQPLDDAPAPAAKRKISFEPLPDQPARDPVEQEPQSHLVPLSVRLQRGEAGGASIPEPGFVTDPLSFKPIDPSQITQPPVEFGAEAVRQEPVVEAQSKLPVFGKEGTVTRGVSQALAGFGEMALNRPEELLALAHPATLAAITARYAPPMVKSFLTDLGKAVEGDNEALGRAAVVGLPFIAGGAAGALKLARDAKAKVSLENIRKSTMEEPGMKPVAVTPEMVRAEGVAAMEVVPLKTAEVVLPQSTQVLKETIGEKGVPDASQVSETAPVHGNVLRDAQEGKSPETVPVNESQPGVRTEEEVAPWEYEYSGGGTSQFTLTGVVERAEPYEAKLETGGTVKQTLIQLRTKNGKLEEVIARAGLDQSIVGQSVEIKAGTDIADRLFVTKLSKPKSEPKQPGVTSDEIVGMGGAVPSEFRPSGQTATAIKNASVEADRKAMGLEPFEPVARETFAESWDRAMASIDRDPLVQDKLIADLTLKPRALRNTEESALLHHRMVDLKNEYAKATRDLAQAVDDGRTLDVPLLQERVAQWSDKLANLQEITKKAGTEWGRTGAARQRFVADDFTLVSLELQKRAARGGKPITKAERAELQKIADEFKAKNEKLQQHITQVENQLAASEAARVMAELRKAEAQAPTIPEHIQRIVDRIGKTLRKRGDAARERLRGKVFSLSPDVLKDLAEVGADNIFTVGYDFAKWSAKMIEELGEKIKPHLQAVFDASKKLLDDVTDAETGQAPKGRRKVTRKEAQDAIGERKTRIRRQIEDYEERVAQGDFTPRNKKKAEVPRDKETIELEFELDRIKQKFHEGLFADTLSQKTGGERALTNVAKAINTVRAIATGIDFSAVLRQGKYMLQHPVLMGRAFVDMVSAFKSEKNAFRVEQEIAHRKNSLNGFYDRAGLELTDYRTATLRKAEEAFMNSWAHKIPLVAGSQRAYVTFLNRLRADAFDMGEAFLSKWSGMTLEEGRVLANAINVATGRGHMGSKAHSFATLTHTFFAPKFVTSRFQVQLGQPLWHAAFGKGMGLRNTWRARALVASEYARVLLGAYFVYQLAKMAGGTVETDPTSSDFLKIRFGETRIDPLAGVSQATVFLSRMALGMKKPVDKPRKTIYGKVPYGQENVVSVISSFLRMKLAPVPGAVIDWLSGTNWRNQPISNVDIVKEHLLPITGKEIVQHYRQLDVPDATIASILSLFGESISTFEKDRK